MKKLSKLLVLLLVLALTLSLFVACADDNPTPPDPDKPTPTPTPEPETEVKIGSLKDLKDAAAKIAAGTDGYAEKVFVLTADIAVDGDFEPIVGFRGTFDGAFHKISGLVVDGDGKNVGLFETLDGATVKNLIIDGAEISNSDPDCALGILAGSAKASRLDFITVDGALTVGGTRALAGGLVGKAENTVITNVKATVSAEGSGLALGGLVGSLGEGAAVNAGFASLTVSEGNTASYVGAVGMKAYDSAVAYILTNCDKAVGFVDADDYLPSYVIGCGTGFGAEGGAAAADIGYNSADWELSGSEPKLKTGDKTHAAPAVRVDGKAVTGQSYGARVNAALNLPVSDGGFAVGYVTAGGDVWYAGLPVLNDVELSLLTVDYSDLMIFDYVPVATDTAALTVSGKVSYGDRTLDIVGVSNITVAGYETVKLHLAASDGSKLELYLTDAVDRAPAGGMLLALKDLSDNSVVYYMADATCLAGAWTDGSDMRYISSSVAVSDGRNWMNIYFTSTGNFYNTVSYFGTFDVEGERVLSFFVDGHLLSYTDEGEPLLSDGSDAFTIATDIFEGDWVNASGDMFTVEDGKVGGVTLFTMVTDFGSGLVNADAGYVLVATRNGLNKINLETGAADFFATNGFDGTYVSIKNGVVSTIRIEGSNVYFGDNTAPVAGSLTVDKATAILSFTYGDVEYSFVRAGARLEDADNAALYYVTEAVDGMMGDFVLGTVKFTIANGKVTYGSNTENVTLSVLDDKLCLVAGKLVFTLGEKGGMTVTGYESAITKADETVELFTESEAALTLQKLRAEYIATQYNINYAPVKLTFVDGVLSIDGVAYDYQLVRYYGNVALAVYYTPSGKIIRITPNGEKAGLNNETWGDFLVTGLAEAVGAYYEFLTGDNTPGEIPDTLELKYDGRFIVNGKTFNFGSYDIEINGDTVVLNAKDADSEYTVTFLNKTAAYNGKTYTNYDRILPDTSYSQLDRTNGTKLDVIKGSVGYYDSGDDGDDDDDYDDYDDYALFAAGDGDWVDAVYPLFGFRLTTDAGVFTSKSFTWKRNADGTATVNVSAESADGTAKTFSVTYDDATRGDRVVITVDGVSTEAYTVANLSTISGEYVAGDNSFSFSSDGIVKVDGVAVDYTHDFNLETGVYAFTADGKTYTLNGARREVLKCGDTTYYDARLAHFAGMSLVAYGIHGIDKVEKSYHMLLTGDGLTFNGKLVTWKNYDAFMFDAVIGDQTVTWRTQDSGKAWEYVYSFGIGIYPQYGITYDDGTKGYESRYFIPELLVDNVGAYAVGDEDAATIFKIGEVVGSGTSFSGITVSVGSLNYNFNQYTVKMDGTSLVLTTYDEKNVITITPGDEVSIKLNGVEHGDYMPPDISGFLTDKLHVLGDTTVNGFVKLEADGEGGYKFTYGVGSSFPKEGNAFSYGKLNGEDVLFIQPNSYTRVALIKIDGEIYAVHGTLFDFVKSEGLVSKDGKALKFAFAKLTAPMYVHDNNPDGDLINVTVKIGDAKPVQTIIGARNYNKGNSEYFARFSDGGVDYAVAVNPDSATADAHKLLIMTFDDLSLVREYGNTTHGYKLVVSVYYDETTGLGKRKSEVVKYSSYYDFTLTSFEPVAGKTGHYKIVGVYDSYGTIINFTDYAIYLPGGQDSRAVQILDELKYSCLGTLTDGTTSITLELGLDENGEPTYYATVNKNTYAADVSKKSNSYEISFAAEEQGEDGKTDNVQYIVTVAAGESGNTVNISKLNALKHRFVGKAYIDGGSYYGYFNVELVSGDYTVTYGSVKTAVTSFAFASDNSYIDVVYNGVSYRIVYIAKSASDTNKTAASTLPRLAFIDGSNGKFLAKLVISNQCVFTVTYDGNATENLCFIDDKTLSFTVGDFLYVAEVGDDGNVVVREKIANLGADEYAANKAAVGNYSDAKVVITVTAEKDADGNYKPRFVATLNGAEVKLTVETDKKIIALGEGSSIKYFYKYDSSTLVSVSASDYAKLISETIDGHTIKVVAGSVYYYGSYRFQLSYLFDGKTASVSTKTALGGEKADLYTVTEDDGSKSYYIVYIDGDAKSLTEISEEEGALLSLSNYATVGGKSMYLKGALKMNSETKAFSVVYTFGTYSEPVEVTLADVDGVEGAQTINGYSDGAVYYYLTAGTKYYIVDAAAYALYGEFTASGKTLKFTWGESSASMIAMKDASGNYSAPVTYTTGNDGTHDYYQFTIDGTSYILAKNSGGEYVLSVIDLYHISNYLWGQTIVKDMTRTKTYAYFNAKLTILDDGTATIAFLIGSSADDCAVITDYEEISNGEVIKMTVDGTVKYFAVATDWYKNSANYWKKYIMAELTGEEQAKFIGSTGTLDGAVCTILADSYSSSSAPDVKIFIGSEADNWGTKESLTFSEDGKSATFTHGGATYTVTVAEDGSLNIVKG